MKRLRDQLFELVAGNTETLDVNATLFVDAQENAWIGDESDMGGPKIRLSERDWRPLESHLICCFGGNLVYSNTVHFRADVRRDGGDFVVIGDLQITLLERAPGEDEIDKWLQS